MGWSLMSLHPLPPAMKGQADGLEQLSTVGRLHRFANCPSDMSAKPTFTRRSCRLPTRSSVDSMSNSFFKRS